jgi:hypothetical protein
MGQQGAGDVKKMTNFSLSDSILLRGVWTRSLVDYPLCIKKVCKFPLHKLKSIVRSEAFYGGGKLSFY